MIKGIRDDILFVMDVKRIHKSMTNKAKIIALQNLKNEMITNQEDFEETSEYVIVANAANVGKLAKDDVYG